MTAEELSKLLAATFLKNGNYEALGSPFADGSSYAQPAAVSAVEQHFGSDSGFSGLAVHSVDEKTLRAATNLGSDLEGKPWFSNVGLAEEESLPVLVVYLKRKPKNLDTAIPQTWEGIPVRLKEIGKVRPIVDTKKYRSRPE